ncbi:MAG: MucB/RseB C-terminal domain-containing protein [Gammaproteobacteria bacterium]|nr:siderophore-interacting protein [Rhodocyclaceae bacterium]MBU3907914.1 MucB/RseB C-terminal domain-containing protein [Gammaproteobacteria bacterium]MBU3989615.1 MucB/RseB C-terminal domain-containing protein [Gammaproteobacteria bacterium]MBU4003820.1 MucB/RseB C-terminal domain-containing protein [Gammaproteobacteria bacterium]MBU4021698.1 MucB/RseB C-terminal domain-containing protein [Gammaproteobacteria bacterium]
MKIGLIAWLGLAASLLSPPILAQTSLGQQEALQWLQRVASSAQTLSYSGTFVYRNGSQSETSRIVHVVSDGNRREKLEVLDGSPREIIRFNDEVKCYLPESRLVIIEQRSTRRAFPALSPASLAGLGEHYVIRKGLRARIAGHDSQIVRLEPRDAWRYGQQFWVDLKTGLLLKADLFDERGGALESLAFTELRIGAPTHPDALKSSFPNTTDTKDAWQVRQAKSREMRDDSQWLFRIELPGFRRQAAMRRSIEQTAAKDAHEVLHWVFSDGLAAVSVFINPLSPQADPVNSEAQSFGAISVVKRVIDGHQVVVMGDVPPHAVKRFAEGIEVRIK